MRYFNEIAKAGGTDKAIVAQTAESLKTQKAISQLLPLNYLLQLQL